MKLTKRLIQKAVTIAAIVFALLLCADLLTLGHASFNNAMHKGEAHYTVSVNWLTQLRISVEYITLNIIYLVWLVIPSRVQTSNVGQASCLPAPSTGETPALHFWLRLGIRHKEASSFSRFVSILKSTAIFLLVAFIAYPSTADIYTYLHFGLMSLQGVNPFINTAHSFTSTVSPFIEWGQTSTYGPISILMFRFASFFVTITPVIGVYVFKILCLLLHIINGYLIWCLLKSSEQRSKITTAYLLNPLLLFEQVASAHVDVFVSTSLIVLIWCLRYHSYVMGLLAIWIGFLAKTLPVIWFPFLLVFLLRQRRWKSLVVATILSLAIFFILWLTVLPNIESWKSLLNPGVSGRVNYSLHNTLSILLDKIHGFSPNLMTHSKQSSIIGVFTRITYIGFIVYYLWILSRVYFERHYADAKLVLDIGWVTLALFLLSTPWLMPWYTSILLPVAALNSDARRFVLVSLSLSFYSSLCYLPLSPIVESILIFLPIAALVASWKLSSARFKDCYVQ